MLSGQFVEYNNLHFKAINTIPLQVLARSKIHIFNSFHMSRQMNFLARLRVIKDLKFYRQTWEGMAALYLAALLGLL